MVGESLEGKLFNFLGDVCGEMSETALLVGASPDQLKRSVFSRQYRQSQHLLSINHALQGSDTIFRSDETPYINDAANVVDTSPPGLVRFPQFALRQSQRMQTASPLSSIV